MKLHCEIDAIYNMDKEQTRNSTAYIAGLTVCGNKMTTKPCNICLNALENAGIRRIVYTEKEEIREIK